jgi:hypothetical protein
MIFTFINVQCTIDKNFPYSPKEKLLYMPSGKFIKGVSLAYDEMVSDFLWIRLIGYFATHAKTDRDYKWFNHFANIIVELDPYSWYVYEIGGVIMSAEMKLPHESNELLQKGMKNVPKNHDRYWKLPFFIAFNHMYYLKDFKTAAHYLKIAAKDEDSPKYIPLLIAKLYANADYHDTAGHFLYEMLKSTKDATLRQQIQTRIEELVNDRNIRVLETARDQFLKDMGRYPFLLDELVIYGYIKKLPDNIENGSYYIDLENHGIFHTILGGKLVIKNIKDNWSPIEIITREKDRP